LRHLSGQSRVFVATISQRWKRCATQKQKIDADVPRSGPVTLERTLGGAAVFSVAPPKPL
ncbi:MAG: hypothetical protein WA412_15290, partial [Candidatus Sulfotelmatobacter sp.]